VLAVICRFHNVTPQSLGKSVRQVLGPGTPAT